MTTVRQTFAARDVLVGVTAVLLGTAPLALFGPSAPDRPHYMREGSPGPGDPNGPGPLDAEEPSVEASVAIGVGFF